MKFAIQKRVLSVELITDDFVQCVRAKIMAARGSCHGPTCPLECKTALLVTIGTLDGSCCDQLGMGAVAGQQCCTAMKLQLVPQMKQVVAEKCPSYVNFDFVANGLIDVKFANEKRVPSVVNCG